MMDDVDNTKNEALESMPQVLMNKSQLRTRHQRNYCMVAMIMITREIGKQKSAEGMSVVLQYYSITLIQ